MIYIYKTINTVEKNFFLITKLPFLLLSVISLSKVMAFKEFLVVLKLIGIIISGLGMFT